MKTSSVIILAVWLMGTSLFAQKERFKNPLGLSVEYGFGSTAIVDEFISKERYSGNLPYIGFWYGRQHEKSAYQVGLTYQKNESLKNYTITAGFSRVSLNYDLWYPVKHFQIFNQPSVFSLGPSIEYFEYEFSSNFISNHRSFSELIMASLGMNFLLDYQLSDKFSAGLFLRTNILGVSAKTHDNDRYEDMDTMFLGLIVANNLNADLLVKYRIWKFLSAGLKYKAQYTRSTSWDPSKNFTNTLAPFLTFHI
jgi:hypothetical protein